PGVWSTAMQVRDTTGHVATTRRRVNAGSAVTMVPNFLGATNGGSVQVQLDVGPGGAGNIYLVLASLSGTSPGFVWQPGFPVPLNNDFVTQAFASAPNSAFLQNGMGLFDANG